MPNGLQELISPAGQLLFRKRGKRLACISGTPASPSADWSASIWSETRRSGRIPASLPPASVFTESLEPLQTIYHDNLSACLRFDEDTFLPIQTGRVPGPAFRKRPFG